MQKKQSQNLCLIAPKSNLTSLKEKIQKKITLKNQYVAQHVQAAYIVTMC